MLSKWKLSSFVNLIFKWVAIMGFTIVFRHRCNFFVDGSQTFDDNERSVADIISKLSISDTFSVDAQSPPLMTSSETKFPQVDHHTSWVDSGKFEGDIDGVNPRFGLQFQAGIFRNAIKDKNLRWPNGIVPYILDSSFTDTERRLIKKAMETYHQKTCIKFVTRSSESDYLKIYKDLGCYSMVGRTSGAQDVSLGRGCVYHEIIVHELMHALGFWHEQSRSDRDNYISVRWENIVAGMEGQFNKIDLAYTDYLGESYDYFSVMHYDSRAFSKNGLNTIESVKPGMTQVLGKALDLSEVDLKKVNKLYECDSKPGPNSIATSKKPNLPLPPTRPECTDRFLDCPFFYRYCLRPGFYFVMKMYCPKTCNNCPSIYFDEAS